MHSRPRFTANDLDALEADPDVANVSADAVVTSDAAAEETADGIPSPLLGTLGLDAVETTARAAKTSASP